MMCDLGIHIRLRVEHKIVMSKLLLGYIIMPKLCLDKFTTDYGYVNVSASPQTIAKLV